jgi:excisionase family DNA binding protein
MCAGRSADSALVAGLVIIVAQQDRELELLRRQAGPPLLTTAGVAERLGVSPGSVRAWTERGQLACVILPGGERRFTVEGVTALLAACERELSRTMLVQAGQIATQRDTLKTGPVTRPPGNGKSESLKDVGVRSQRLSEARLLRDTFTEPEIREAAAAATENKREATP